MWIDIGCFGIEFGVWFALLSLVPLSLAMLIDSINIVHDQADAVADHLALSAVHEHNAMVEAKSTDT